MVSCNPEDSPTTMKQKMSMKMNRGIAGFEELNAIKTTISDNSPSVSEYTQRFASSGRQKSEKRARKTDRSNARNDQVSTNRVSLFDTAEKIDEDDKNLLCYTEKTRDGFWVAELLQEKEHQELINASLNFFNREK